jgi:phage terminase large subunit GpA-like protein
MADLTEIRRAALRSLVPPPRLALSDWIERNIVLPADTSALPGPVRLYAYQKQIADCISDPAIERVSVQKASRVGYTVLLTATVAAFIANEPTTILVLQPTESDARDFTVSDLEPVLEATPATRGLLAADTEEGQRNTLLSKRFAGGSLKVVAARAPRNLRRHTCRILLADECDGYETTAEGNPLRLAERRTATYANRKLICGSSPVDQDTSNICRLYGESDQRIFEVPCPECGAFHEITWACIEWESGKPETAAFRCPSCKALLPERFKAQMIGAGQWRATRPEVRGHAGFKISALSSLLPNAAWGKLAAEFLSAREDPELLRTFVNTCLGEPWSSPGTEIDEGMLQSRAEPFGLDNVPPEVLIITAGIDCQTDRLECTICGWTKTSECLVLSHSVIWGSPTEDSTVWLEADELLRSRFKHAYGGMLGIDACIIDSGFATEQVYSFAFPKLSRRIWAGKGMSGARPALQVAKLKAKSAMHGGRLFLVGTDVVKNQIFNRLQHGRSIRFSKSLEPVFYEQLTSERRTVKYSRGKAIRAFERKSHRSRSEALDCVVYNFAARSGLTIPLDAREEQLRNPEAAAPPPAVYRSKFMTRHGRQ